MRHGKLPRLRPPRVESWRARRGGLEGAGKNWGGFTFFFGGLSRCAVPRSRETLVD